MSDTRAVRRLPWLAAVALAFVAVAMAAAPPAGDPAAGERRRARAQEFHRRAQEPTGVLVPLYAYPADVHTNATYNRLSALKRRFETVPFWVILNPASGPGRVADANYTKAVDRLAGAGCVVLGYVTTGYAERPERDVRADVARWAELYPRVQGIFFDEMVYEDTDAGAAYQAALNRAAHDAGWWPTVANPGAETPGRYFAPGAEAADVVVVHEGDAWPAEERLKGDYFGGYADFPPFTRGVLVHSQAAFDPAPLRMVRQYARWVYVTEGVFKPNDPKLANPWDRLSAHLEATCQELARD
jgi:hypothetical protein